MKENTEIPYNSWGDDIDVQAHAQMKNACSLSVARYGALMPDAHVGYGLPIGGVLATKNSVIPYAVGVDIACRVMISVLDIPPKKLSQDPERFEIAIQQNTRFGVGAKWKDKKSHEVMDADWSISSIVRELKDLAWSQLGTSGSGNHFVEFGFLSVETSLLGLNEGEYLALVSHSGSRGVGSKIADHYSKLAMSQHNDLPKELRHLSWLPMHGDGAEYWEAMELMGRYASANHHLIHEDVIRSLGTRSIFAVENHHNFAWKESHFGEDVIVHRKGAVPAMRGLLGYIPGSMVAPGYLVEGTGNEASLKSCSHGAGRKMSRKAAKKSISRKSFNEYLKEQGVRLISAGLDEAPQAYKDIDDVMRAQKTLVRIIGKFQPKLVKMAPAGERAED